ncbi:MAG: cytochrome c peroxidase [Gemmatimonadota bacterium]
MKRWTASRMLTVGTILLAAACDGTTTDPVAPPVTDANGISTAGATGSLPSLGQQIFFDQNLSFRRNQSCSSCHSPAFGFSSPTPGFNAHGAVVGGSIQGRFGNRRPPSAAYAAMSPVFSFSTDDDTYVGGNFWNGRATGEKLGNPAADQAQAPFLNPVEQGLPDAACVIHRIAASRYANIYRAVWGKRISNIVFPPNVETLCSTEGVTVPLSVDDRTAVDREYDHVALAIAAYEASPAVSPFRSRFDAWREGHGTLSPQEIRGFGLYVGKAGCEGCHPSAGDRALFTDFTYDNIGVPANPENPARIANGFVDGGLGDRLGDPSLEGQQKVATLRNLDKRPTPGAPKGYMHNGVFKTLEQVVHFYNTRDVLPACASAIGPTDPAFGRTCWPAPEVLENVNRDELGNLGMNHEEELDVVAFLKTLSDQ